jgi:uncharacterized protein YdhG (YjbR/CyaY superfamily)
MKGQESAAPGAPSVDEYIRGFPQAVQEKLEAIRAAIRTAVPEAEERISYQMPAFFHKGILVYYGAFKNHISIFPTADGVDAFRAELGGHVHARGTVRFQLAEELPLDLIARIAAYRAAANERRETGSHPATRKTR